MTKLDAGAFASRPQRARAARPPSLRPRHSLRSAPAAGALLLVLLPVSALAAPKENPAAKIDVVASCERKATKGRVICDVELEAASARIAWADVVVTGAPAFAPPLRSRVAITDARSRSDKRVRLPVALIATSQGRGTVSMRARAVLCVPSAPHATETCRPSTKDVTAEIVVGTDVEH